MFGNFKKLIHFSERNKWVRRMKKRNNLLYPFERLLKLWVLINPTILRLVEEMMTYEKIMKILMKSKL
jgi:hypothetical protein